MYFETNFIGIPTNKK